jgi:DNA-binding FadR family transcriptional regulator
MTDQALGRAASSAVRALREKIDAGAFDDGLRLPAERDLAAELGVARNTLRQALQRLEEDGLLERHVGRGTFVRRPEKANGRATQAPLFNMRRASPSDLMEVRLIIEPQVATLAASRASAEDFAVMETALRNSISARGLAEFEHWDAQLHLAIFRATKNAVLIDYCQAINAARNEPNWYRLKKRTITPELRIAYDRQHSDLVSALKDRDTEAARRYAHIHLTMVRDNLLGTLE